jgi:hypothetical protein
VKSKLITLLFGLAVQLCSITSANAQVTVPTGGSLTVPAGGTLGLGCTGLNVAGSFALNSGQVSGASGVAINAGGTLNGGSGTLNVSGNWSNVGTFVPGTGSVIFNDGCASGPITISGTTVFNNLTLTSTNGRTFVLPEGSNITVNGILTLQGTPGTPIQLVSSGSGTAVVNLGPSATVVRNNATVNGNVQIGAAAAATSIPTLSQWAMILLAGAMGLSALAHRRRTTHY